MPRSKNQPLCEVVLLYPGLANRSLLCDQFDAETKTGYHSRTI